MTKSLKPLAGNRFRPILLRPPSGQSERRLRLAATNDSGYSQERDDELPAAYCNPQTGEPIRAPPLKSLMKLQEEPTVLSALTQFKI